MFWDILILTAIAIVSYGGYNFIKSFRSDLKTKFEVIYYMLCDLSKRKDDK